LQELGLLEHTDYIQQYYVKDIKSFYDFYLPRQRVLIETDGDFWHCNPNSKYKEAKYSTQRRNLITDAKKNNWASANGIPLLRFWESDIKKHPEQVISKLQEIL
jgi:very-short-patch-repair endonuclease